MIPFWNLARQPQTFQTVQTPAFRLKLKYPPDLGKSSVE